MLISAPWPGVLLALLAACSSTESAPIVGTLERHRIEVAATASEQIIQLAVREGDVVQSGQLLAELDSGVQTAQSEALAAQVQQQRGRLRELQNGARIEERTVVQARLTAAQADLAQAEKEYQRLLTLSQQGLVATSQLDLQQRARAGAMAAVTSARADVQLLQVGTRREQLQQAQAALAASTAQLTSQTIMQGRLRLTAPMAGRVESIPYRVGERPPLGAPVVVMLDAGAPFVRVYVPEQLRAAIAGGDTVTVRVDGVSTPQRGVVRYIAGEASFTPYYALTQRDRSRLVFVAEIDLPDAASSALPVGVPVEVTLAATTTAPKSTK
jgi:HlyD family secretion protein